MNSAPLSVSALARRVREELGTLIDASNPVTVSWMPQSIDVIGGLLDGHGGPRCSVPIDRYLSVLMQPRTDGQILVFDFNEYDNHRPFTLQISVDGLRNASLEALMKNLREPGRAFAAPVVRVLYEQIRSSQGDGFRGGFNLVLSRDIADIPSEATVVAAATASVLRGGAPTSNPVPQEQPETFLTFLECSQIQSGGASGGIGHEVTLIELPHAIQVVALACEPVIQDRSNIDIAARMAHRMVLEKMRAFGQQAGRELISDPMNGQLGNLAMSDYKRFFRGTLPETIRGRAFITQFGSEGMNIDPTLDYSPQLVADHLVIETHRVREFVRYLGEAKAEAVPHKRQLALDKAGHLLYASHKSARDNCGFGTDEADRIVDAVRANEYAGLFGAALSSSANGSWVGVLCRSDASSDEALERIAASPSAQVLQTPAPIGRAGSAKTAFLADLQV